jgi:hypothetical protein
MKKHADLFAVCSVDVLVVGCNYSAASVQSLQAPSGNPTTEITTTAQETVLPSLAPTSTATVMRGLTPGPTSTLVSAADCPPYAGEAFFEVKDAVILNLAEDQTIARICWVGEQPIKPVLAWGHVDVNQPEQVYQDTTGWRFDRVDFVYRIDLERETFTPISPEGVVCLEVFEGGD